MATVLDIVRRAHLKLGVIDRVDSLEAEYADEGVNALNEMLHGWKLDGVDVSHSDVGLTDTFPLDDEYQIGTIYMLAAHLSPEFIMPANFDPDQWLRKLQAAYYTIPEITMPAALLRPPSRDDREDGYSLD